MNSQNASAPAANSSFQDARVIALVGLAHTISHFFHLILIPLFPWIKTAYGLSYTELGLIVSVFFVCSAIVQAMAGFVVDEVGAKPVLFAGIGCLGLSALVLGLGASYAALLLGAGIAGIGNGVFHPADYSLLNHRVSTAKLGYAFSVHGVSGNLGWAAAPVFMIGITKLFNWHVALLCAGGLALAVLALLFANRDTLDYPGARSRPAAEAQPAPQAAPGGTFGFMKLPQVWLCWAFLTITTLSFAGFQSFAPLALTQIYGMPLTLATAAYTAYVLSIAGGIVLGGYATSRTRRPDRLIVVCFLGSGLLTLLVASGAMPAAAVPVLFAAIGFGAGVAGPSRDLMIRAAAPAGAIGRVYGIVYSGIDIGLAVGPLCYALLMDHRHPNAVFVVIGLFQILAIFTAVTVGKTNRQRSSVAVMA